MPIDSPFDSLVGIRSPFGNRRAFAPSAPVSPPDAYASSDWEFVWKESADVVPQGFDAADWEFVYREKAVPATAPAPRYDPPTISQDAATYDPFVSVNIPTLAIIEQRLFKLTYGRKDVPEGTFAEGDDSYVRIVYSDLDANVVDPLDPVNFSVGAFAIPPDALNGAAIDSYMHPLPDGRMYWSLSVVDFGDFGNLAAYACILTNPLSDPSEWQFGPWSYIGDGIANRPHTHKGEVRQTTATVPGTSAGNGVMTYNKIEVDGNVIIAVPISTIPNAPVAVNDLNVHETSFGAFGANDDSIRCTLRTKDGPYTTVSTDNGQTWATPVPVVWDGVRATNVTSKTHLTRSPSGRYIWAYNAETSGFDRRHMTISIHNDITDFNTAPLVDFTFDTRGGNATSGTAVSYPDVIFPRNENGAWTGKIYLAYDYGRGDPASANETYIVVFDEQDLIDNAPIANDNGTHFTRYTFGP